MTQLTNKEALKIVLEMARDNLSDHQIDYNIIDAEQQEKETERIKAAFLKVEELIL